MATNDKIIQVQNLKKHYNKGTIKALDGVTVDINRGDVMVVIGPSGSGKSTFLRCLNLLEKPDSGEVWLDGTEIPLTPKEFSLLRCLMLHRGLVLSREQLLVKCWGYDYEGEARAVDTHIRRLRDKGFSFAPLTPDVKPFLLGGK